MTENLGRLFLGVALSVVGALHVHAGPILQPVNVTTDSIPSAFVIGNTIDQSGLTANYISGSTNFDTFVASTGHINNNPDLWKTFNIPTSQTLPIVNSFDLGAVFDVDGFAIWHTFAGFHVDGFELFSDNDFDFTNGGTTSLGTFNAPVNNQGNPFSFNATTTQFIHMQITSKATGSDITEGEFAFRQVPEPTTLALTALGLLGIGWRRRKRA